MEESIQRHGFIARVDRRGRTLRRRVRAARQPRLATRELLIELDSRADVAEVARASTIQHQHARTDPRNLIHVVADQHERRVVADASQPFVAFGTKRDIAHRQDFIQQQHVRLQRRRHRETEPHLHAGAVALHRRVDELADLREIHDLVELGVDFLSSSVPARSR